MAFKTQQEIYEIALAELQAQKPSLTDVSEGSINDVLLGVIATAVSEVTASLVEELKKTYFDTADGPEVTGGPDDLERLAVDHFGSDFARPAAVAATGSVTFSRPTTAAGNVSVPAGTVVKTETNAAGVSIRFETDSLLTMTGLTLNADVTAVVEGTSGNVTAGTVTVLESSLTDPTITVTNASAMSGGSDEMSDSEYRERIRNLITRIRGATKAAIESAAEAVDGIDQAVAIETEIPVIEYDIAESAIASGAEFFRIPYVTLYVCDENGAASNALIEDVEDAMETVRAYGVNITVEAAEAVEVDWTASITLNVSGPNYATLSTDTQMLEDEMSAYLAALGIGDDFDVSAGEAAVMAVWGPSGTNDLTAFSTSVPSGDVETEANQKIVPGTMTISV